MTSNQLNNISIPLMAASEACLLAVNAVDADERAYHERRLRGRLQDIASHMGYRLVPQEIQGGEITP